MSGSALATWIVRRHQRDHGAVAAHVEHGGGWKRVSPRDAYNVGTGLLRVDGDHLKRRVQDEDPCVGTREGAHHAVDRAVGSSRHQDVSFGSVEPSGDRLNERGAVWVLAGGWSCRGHRALVAVQSERVRRGLWRRVRHGVS